MPLVTACPNCGGRNQYTRRVESAGGQGLAFLPGLGRFLHFAQFDAVVCADCGLTRLFAEPAAREKLATAAGWRPLAAAARCSRCGYDLRATPDRCPECGTEQAKSE